MRKRIKKSLLKKNLIFFCPKCNLCHSTQWWILNNSSLDKDGNNIWKVLKISSLCKAYPSKSCQKGTLFSQFGYTFGSYHTNSLINDYSKENSNSILVISSLMLFTVRTIIGVNKTSQKISKYFCLFLLLFQSTCSHTVRDSD